MARYSQSLLDLLQEEDRIVTEIEITKDKIVENLYITEESKDKNKLKSAREAVVQLRESEDCLEKELKDIRRDLRHRLLQLFE